MSSQIRITIIILTVVVLAGIAGYIFLLPKAYAPESTTETFDLRSSNTLPTGTDTSNEALSQDIQTIEAQLDAFESDNASIEASITDAPVEQGSI